jgi:cation:H+ antiporter
VVRICAGRRILTVAVSLAVTVFFVSAIVSLGMSWVLVVRIERLGERLSMSGALLGTVAALAADTPEITSAITAMVVNEKAVGAGVVIGSNVFNLAALLGLGAIVAVGIALHRKVVILTGAVALCVAVACLVAVLGIIPPAIVLAVVLAVMIVYVLVLVLGEVGSRGLPLPEGWRTWLSAAVAEEGQELGAAAPPGAARPMDGPVAGLALLVVVGASVALERSASALGHHYGVAQIVLGGVVLAAATSLPNAVAAVYLAVRKRGSAVFSTALNSNAFNVLVGFLLPASVVGLPGASGHGTFVAAWYVGITFFAVGWAYLDRGLRRDVGLFIVVTYFGFVASLLVVAYAGSIDPVIEIGAVVAAAAISIGLLLKSGRGGIGEDTLEAEGTRRQKA